MKIDTYIKIITRARAMGMDTRPGWAGFLTKAYIKYIDPEGRTLA